MLSKIFFFLLISTQLFSQIILKDIYPVESKNIYLNDIIKNSPKNELLFTIDENKYSKRVKSSQIIKLLKKIGIKDIKSSSRYVQFKLLSPIDTTKIEEFLRQHYIEKYKTINIQNIFVNPRGYIESLPKNYHIEIRDKSYLSRNGIINIKDQNNKKIFLNYSIEATIKVLNTKDKIDRGEKISLFNTNYKTIKLDKFKATPITKFKKDTYQTSRHINKDKTLTIRDIETLNLIHKNSQVSVGLYNGGIYITFIAKALQNGKLGDIITIQKSDLKRLKARVVGKNKVEIK